MLPERASAQQVAESFEITSYYGNYDASRKQRGQHALSLRGPKMEIWQRAEKPQKQYSIGVLIPHLKDAYWLAVNYGIADESANMGIHFTLSSAGGYNRLAIQQRQMREFIRQGVDGIILGSISYSGNNQLVAQAAASNIPVVEIINDIEAQHISAKALVSFYEMGFFAGEFLTIEAEGKESISVIFLPGPKNSGWADESLEGFLAATEFFDGTVDVHDVQWGDTGETRQAALLRKALTQNPDVDYIVGNAVAASVAPTILDETDSKARVVATYITPPVYSGIREGRIAAAPADMTVHQARMAVGMLIRLMEGQKAGKDFPFRAGPHIPVITQTSIANHPYEFLFGPRDFAPVYQTP